MVDEIRADYEALAQVAARFNSRAEATTEMLTSVQTAFTPLEQGSWIGESAEAFFVEMEEDVIPAVNRLIAALTMAGEITGEAAQTMQQADQEAATPFQEEEQGGGGSSGGSGGGSGGGLGGGEPVATAAEAMSDASPGGGAGGGLGDFGGADFGSGFGGGLRFGGAYGIGDAGANAVGEVAGAPVRFRYQATPGSGVNATESGFSRPATGAAMAAAGAKQGGMGALVSLLATSPFLATMLGKFGKKRGEE
ncbi:MAG TPA: WXG100 family type VII secretion target [Chloroflexi bacterium]|nr:WXG100 family type VII secretion target [Chloroflexota bacterium]